MTIPLRRAALLSSLIGFGLSACAAPAPEMGVDAALMVPGADSWEAAILPEDAVRLGNRANIWRDALALTAAANPGLIAREGAILQQGGASDAVPASGDYRCRTIKLGVEALGGIAYDWFRCRVDDVDGQTWLVKETGSQRQSGRVFGGGVFLGGFALGDESGAVAYRALADRNVVGMLEMLSAGHYRLVQPQPAHESMLDILEMKAR
ncbi:DUF4893 domain-containing protein [Pacificimonas sp. WHA3]|uniref:DUF4893 domain-containing protein n=1 Tax=Pacificimonas pallii TaxID=2827236 RepID=A0ABS6SHH9_9SPHN|nr:DUF4893 domain-containing protein [Pacificimonas pallii]MBV7257862.1 DUF4893 domain-containing protein [Pacificimonas pallii]